MAVESFVRDLLMAMKELTVCQGSGDLSAPAMLG